MVKAYLRYVFDGAYGAVSGNGCQLVEWGPHLVSASGQYIVMVNRKTGECTTTPIPEKNVEIT
jgi:hypothetical protein